MNYRAFLFAAASVASLWSSVSLAQTATKVAASEVDEVVVTGTRATGRTRLESLAPVDVISAQNLRQQGSTELAAALAATVPSIDFPRPSNTDATDAVRPATLRGQGPDQTLVLINGVRAHTAATLNLNGSVGRGSAAVDLNTIPNAALDHIEVLRDGASALYGSDAIAGVLNLQLRKADHGGGASATYGEYVTSFDGFYGRRGHIHDGGTVTVDGWQGLQLGSDGFLTISAEYLNRNHTNRSDIDPRETPLKVRSRVGDGDVEQGTGYINAGKPIGDNWEILAWGGGQYRKSSTAATLRLFNNANNLLADYPDGFIPHIVSKSSDANGGTALKGDIAGWKTNIGVDYGWNQVKFDTENSINATLGPNSQHNFYAGKLTYDQWVGNADFNRDFDVGMAGPLNVAFGLEARREGFQIGAGERNSYIRGTVLPTLSPGAQGFPGFQPSNVVDKHRTNVGGYIALEGKVLDQLTLSGAVRQEHYSDFGDNTSGKISARYEFTPAFAIRGSAETGFRAPSLQQQYYTSTSTLFINGVPFDQGTYPATSPVGTALGGKPLKPEKSKNYALGFVFHQGPFEFTVDGYQISIHDRIVLSESLTNTLSGGDGAVIGALLAPYGSTSARFFINGVNTRTRGVDVVAHYRILDDQAGTFDLTAAGNYNDLKVTKTPVTPQTFLPTPVPLFARQAVLRFEDGTPEWKMTLQGDWNREKWGATVRTTFYGDVNNAGTILDGSGDVHTGSRGIVDAEARYKVTEMVTLSLGANNLFDVYPRQIAPNINTTGAAPFTGFSPYGFNGRFVYGRVAVNW